MEKKPVMEYRKLGNTGLYVSCIGYGNFVNSALPEYEQQTIAMIKKAYELGINFFDTAEAYGLGEAERQMGKGLKALGVPREKYIVSTKCIIGPSNHPSKNHIGLSRKHVIECIRQSLKNLDLQYVDVYFAHAYDGNTPMEEICRAFDWCVRKGFCHYWGTSSWKAQFIFEAFSICEKYNLIKPVTEQPHYNMLWRDAMESDYYKLFDKYKYGSTIWSPLGSGFLTGRYNDGNIPEDSRMAIKKNQLDTFFMQMVFDRWLGPNYKEKTLAALNGIKKIADELKVTMAQLAVAWVLVNKDVSVALTGGSKPENLEDTIKAVELYPKLTPEILKRIEEVLKNKPQTEGDVKTFTPFPSRR